MPKTVLGIQLGASSALAVHLKGGWKSSTVTRVTRLELSGATPDERGAALADAALPAAEAVVAALPADAAFPRIVELPFSDRSRVVQAAPLEAEESLPLPLEELICHAQVLERRGGGAKALLVAAPTARVTALLGELAGGGLKPLLLDVEALALATVARRSLPQGESAAVVDLAPGLCQAVALGADGPWTFHAFSTPATGPALPSEVAAVLAHWRQTGGPVDRAYLSGPGAAAQDLAVWSEALGRPVELLPFPAEGLVDESGGAVTWPEWAIPLGLAMREGAGRQASQINLLQGPFAPAQEAGPWKRLAAVAGVYLGLLAVLWGLGVWSESAYRDAQYQTLRADTREVFREALPKVQNIVSEVDQMRTAVRELESRAQSLGSLVDREVAPLRILREISSRIPKDLEVEFRDYTVEEGRVRIEGVTTSFDAIDRIKADLAQFPRFASVAVSDAKAGVERDKVIFKLTIALGREG